jgi:hypothetical protein
MARILIQTNDRRTVLDERIVQSADLSDERSERTLLDRLKQAVDDVELGAPKRSRIRRLAAIVPASDYRCVGA